MDAYLYAACSGVIGATSVLLGGVMSRLLILLFGGNGDYFRGVNAYVFLCGLDRRLTNYCRTSDDELHECLVFLKLFMNNGLYFASKLIVRGATIDGHTG